MRHTFLPVTIFVLLLFIIITPVNSFSAQEPDAPKRVVKLWQKCAPGSYRQPNGPFVVLVFCEGAIGNYIALYYEKAMDGPISADFPKWTVIDRVWQDWIWASDVTGFAWSPSGKFLYVGTSNVYGKGGIFEVDLAHRSSKHIFPVKEPEGGYGYWVEILELDENKSLLKVRESIEAEENPKTTIHEVQIQR